MLTTLSYSYRELRIWQFATTIFPDLSVFSRCGTMTSNMSSTWEFRDADCPPYPRPTKSVRNSEGGYQSSVF